MKFNALLVAATFAGAAVAAPPKPTPTRKRQESGFQFTGVNESGAEFGNLAILGQLGKDYTWPDQTANHGKPIYPTAELFVVPSWSYQLVMLTCGKTLINQGFNTERLVPNQLSGAIDETYASSLDTIVEFITGKWWWADYMYGMEPPSGAAYTDVLPSITQFI
ncbi:hypothetical protein F4809DRAFT_643878 [Biscogniauxia mediterranea]|nr:hypothetical protein F4809DRAFT_643878 [Biscogniauxia mediterranea]